MNFNRKAVICALAFLAQSGISFNVFAATGDSMNAGKIHFTGQLVEASCKIAGDSGTDINVPLGTYLTSQFAASGDESDLIPFTITLSGCPVSSDGLSSVQLSFTGTTTLTKSPTLLDVSAISTVVPGQDDAATGIGIAISPAAQPTTLLKFDSSEDQVTIPLTTVVGDTVSASFLARYKSFSDTITAGPADADLTVNILYR